ncbi:11784_t:CDS:2, partial [Funneliformis geosporum]
NEPPLVPYKYPIIGHTFEYYKDVLGFLKKCHEEHGDIFSLYIWGTIQTYVGNENYSEIFKNHHNFDFHEALNDTFPIANILNRPDDYFKDFKKFTKEFLHDLDKYSESVYHKIIKSIDEILVEGKVIRPPINTIQQIIARPIANIIIGVELCDDKELLNTFVSLTADIGLWLSIPPALNFIYFNLHRKFIMFKFRYLNNPIKIHRNVILTKITPVINQRISDKNNLRDSWKRPIDIMQELMDKFMVDEKSVDIESVADFIMIFIFSSVHSTSLTFTQCLFDYVNNHEYHKELLEEAEKIYDDDKLLLHYTISKSDKMERLDHFIKESFRINRMPVSFPHKTVSSQFTFANGFQVPKGRVVQIITQQIYYDQKAFGSDPEKFNPNHHVKSPVTRPERNFIAFGTGKLLCPGRFFAIYEIKVAMHYILLKYNVKSVSGKHVKPKRIGDYILPSDEGLIFEKKRNDKDFRNIKCK